MRQFAQGPGALSQSQLAQMRPRLAPPERLAQEVWQHLGRRLDWAGLLLLIEINDLSDPETLIANLLTLQYLEPHE